MQIVSIRAENFKGLKLVEVSPGSAATVVGGKNRAGKSSFLDAIAATLGGAALCPKRPIRDGETEASVEVKLDGDETKKIGPCTVKRTWKRRKSGDVSSELAITTDEGFRAATPQTILNNVVGPLGFDPERFLRMTTREQAEVLRGLVGLDFTELDKRRDALYAERTEVNRRAKAAKARYEAMPYHADTPAAEVSVSDLLAELRTRQEANRRNAAKRSDAERKTREVSSLAADIEELRQRIVDMQAELARKEASHASELARVAEMNDNVGKLQDADEAEIERRISDAETLNKRVRDNMQRRAAKQEADQEAGKSSDLTTAIESIDREKQRMRESAKWPVDNLGYDESGVTLNGRPFDQASASEQRAAAFAIVAAMNPTLRFAMIKDGSLLDDEGLADFARLAAEKGFQLFVERVGEGEECTVIISDGEIKHE